MKDFNGRDLFIGSTVVAVDSCDGFYEVGAVGKIVKKDGIIVNVEFSHGNFNRENSRRIWSCLTYKLVRV